MATNGLRPDVQQLVQEFTMARTKGGEGNTVEFTVRFRVHPESKAVFLTDAANHAQHQSVSASATAKGNAATVVQALIDRALTE
jgi:hypothetical protein